MTGPMKHVAGAISLLALLAGASTSFAQTGRPWVDPPSEAGGTPPPAAQTPAPSPSTPAPVATPNATSRQERTVVPEASETRRENARAREPEATRERAARADSSSPRKAAETSRSRRSSVRAAAARTKATTTGPRRAMASNRSKASPDARLRQAERFPQRSVRSARVRDAVNSGLEVMSLRTIELPDGRRIDVLVRPSPRALSRLMDEPL
jgi:hypothetical protein